MGQDQNVESEEKELSPNSSADLQSSHCWQCPRCYKFYEDYPSEKCKCWPNNILKRETERNIIRDTTEIAQTDSNASIYRWNCHQCTLENIIQIQDTSGMLTCSLCGYQSAWNDVTGNEIPVRDSEVKASSADVEQEDTTIDPYEMDWFKIVNAVKHEVSPFIASAMERTLKYLSDKDGTWDPSDLSNTSIDEVIARLQQTVALKTKDVDYLQRLLERAYSVQFEDDWWTAHEFTTTYTNLVEKEDFSAKWRGLNSSLLLDIFSVKKAPSFTFEQRADYRVPDFENDVKKTERLWNLGEIELAHFVKSALFRKRLQSVSLYPRWLISDDLFDTMKWIFGVTHFVDRLQAKLSTGIRQRVHVYIIPKKVVSLYDPQEMWEMQNMSAIDQSLEHQKQYAFMRYNPSVVEICDMIQGIYDRIQPPIRCDGDIIILVDRRQLDDTVDESQTLWVYKSKHLQELLALNWNNFLGFEFDIESNVKCWIHFGFGQRVRFYLEFLTSFVPSLFVRPSGSSDMECLKKIYDDQFKHGWAVPLDDPVFNLYYKAITGDDHISNNYNRRKNVKKQNVDRALGFFELLRRQMNVSRFRALQQLLLKQDMDSDAVFDDLLVTETNGSVFIDVSDSNVARWTTYDTINQLRTAIFRWKNIQCKKDNPFDLKDCHLFNVVIDYLKTFQRHGSEVNESNLNQFNLDKVIQSLDHITTVHRLLDPEYRAQIHRYITSHIVCENLKCCETLRKYADRRRECDQSRGGKREYEANDVEERCVVTMDVMNTLHSLLIHRDQTLNVEKRFNRFLNSKETDTEASNEVEKETEFLTNSIDLGISVIRWIPFGERSQFYSFRDEIVCNTTGSIDGESFQHYLIECIAKIRGTSFTLKEMMALKLYTDTTKFTASLRKAHWMTSRLSIKQMYYFWASALYESALYHSAPISSGHTNVPMTLYHGINRMFTVNEDLPKYNGPFSSTTQRSVAHHFTEEQGLYFSMQPSYINKLKCCVGINVESISHHTHEREILLIDQFLPISSTKTFKDSDVALVDYLIFSVRGWKIEIKDSRGFFNQLGIRFNPQWMLLIGSHPELFKLSVCRNRLVITRLIEELKITDWKLSFRNPEVEHVKLVTHLVEQHEMKQLLLLYRVATSKFRVIQSFVIDHCFYIEFIPNIKMDHIGDATTVDDTCFKETQYLINGVAAPYTISKVGGAVHCIQCRNPEFFGERDVLIQEFQSSDDYDSLESEVTDLVENHNVYQLLPHYRVLTSKFNVIQSNSFDICYKLEFIPNDKMDHIGDETTINGSCFRETDYIIDGINVPHTISASAVKGPIHRIQCRNSKLFGDRVVWNQDFESSTDSKQYDSIESEIIDLVEHHAVYQLLPHYRVLTSKFQVIQSTFFDVCYKIEFTPNTKMDHIDANGVDNSCFEETQYLINGVAAPYTVPKVKGAVQHIQCRNPKLFGERDVLIQKFQPRDSFVWEIMDLVANSNVHQLLPHYRVMTSKFRVIQIHSLKLCVLEFIPNTKMDHIAEQNVFDIANNSCFEESEYIVNGVTVPFTVSLFKGTVQRIQCRNSKLFGDRDVWVQTFEEQKESDHSMESEIINSVEQQEVYQLLPHYRVLTSKFKVIQSFAENKVFYLYLNLNTKMDHIGDVGVDTVNDSCFAETEYKINGKVVSHSISSVEGIVKRIECRNIKLFGDRLVWVQEFSDSQDVKEKKLGLAVFEERGHKDSVKEQREANNLLDGKKYSFYWSKRGSLASGRIVFELEQQRSFYPTKLMIRDSAFDNAIKSMVISWSDNGKEFHKWTLIGNIQKGMSNKQWFDFDQKESLVFERRQPQYLRLNVVQNHGDRIVNKFHEFAIYGYSA